VLLRGGAFAKKAPSRVGHQTIKIGLKYKKQKGLISKTGTSFSAAGRRIRKRSSPVLKHFHPVDTVPMKTIPGRGRPEMIFATM